jgi:hypothetical protein
MKSYGWYLSHGHVETLRPLSVHTDTQARPATRPLAQNPPARMNYSLSNFSKLAINRSKVEPKMLINDLTNSYTTTNEQKVHTDPHNVDLFMSTHCSSTDTWNSSTLRFPCIPRCYGYFAAVQRLQSATNLVDERKSTTLLVILLDGSSRGGWGQQY